MLSARPGVTEGDERTKVRACFWARSSVAYRTGTDTRSLAEPPRSLASQACGGPRAGREGRPGEHSPRASLRALPPLSWNPPCKAHSITCKSWCGKVLLIKNVHQLAARVTERRRRGTPRKRSKCLSRRDTASPPAAALPSKIPRREPVNATARQPVSSASASSLPATGVQKWVFLADLLGLCVAHDIFPGPVRVCLQNVTHLSPANRRAHGQSRRRSS